MNVLQMSRSAEKRTNGKRRAIVRYRILRYPDSAMPRLIYDRVHERGVDGVDGCWLVKGHRGCASFHVAACLRDGAADVVVHDEARLARHALGCFRAALVVIAGERRHDEPSRALQL